MAMRKYEKAAMTEREAQQETDLLRADLEAGTKGLEQVAAATLRAAEIEKRGGYTVLGYGTMSEYLAVECGVQLRRAQQILQQGRVGLLLTEVAGDDVSVSARDAAVIVKSPDHATGAFRAALDSGATPQEAIKTAVAKVERFVRRTGPVAKPGAAGDGRKARRGPPNIEGTMRDWRERVQGFVEKLEIDPDWNDFLSHEERREMERTFQYFYETADWALERLSRPPQQRDAEPWD